MRSLVYLIILLSSTFLWSDNLYSASVSSNMDIRVVIPYTGCTIVSSRIHFQESFFGRGINTVGEVVVRCVANTPYIISLDSGLYATGNRRRMRNLIGNYMDYSLYQNNSGAVLWGDGGVTGNPRGFIGNGLEQAHDIFGEVLVVGIPPSGSYSDSVNISIEY